MAPAVATSNAASRFADAVALHLAGQTSAAADAYRDVLAADPGMAEACNNLATILAATGDDVEAEQLLERAIALKDDYGEAHNNLGILRATRGDHAGALPSFERATALDDSRTPWWNNLGNAYVELFRFRDALAAYDHALAHAVDDPECWSNRGLALRGLRRPDEAIASFERALALAPSHVNAMSNLAILLKEQKRLDDAVATMTRAVEIDPANVALWCNFAAIHEARGDYERVRALASHAAQLDPAYPESYNLLANADMEAGAYDEALERYEFVRSLDPENRNANWNLALLWLLKGDFERGWRQFEWRKRLQSVVFDHGEYAGPAWRGESLHGRDILLHAEQGIGDAIQFIRYASLLKSQGARRVYLECPYPIVSLLSGVAGVDAVIARGVPLPAYDVHANLMSIPGLVGTTLSSVPNDVPYIPVEPRPARDLVRAGEGTLNVGIVWAGNPIHARDHLRSAPLEAFRPLAAMAGVRLYSLQKGAAAERALAEASIPGIQNLAPHLDDFRDTAAVIQALDLVITVDTSVAHLAGALGQETWLLLPHVPDFRWMLARSDSPWYPSMRLFRQPQPGDWPAVFAAVTSALRARTQHTPPRHPPAAAATEPHTTDDAIVSLTSVARLPDGRARFDIWMPLAMLADPRHFAEYEAELVGPGADLPIRAFLDEVIAAGDVFVDLAPGVGLTTLSVATAASPPRGIVVADASVANTARLAAIARKRVPTLAVLEATSVSDALTHEALAAAGHAASADAAVGRCLLRVGGGASPDEVVAAVAQANPARRPWAILWSTIAPAVAGASLEALDALGYRSVALSIVDGEPSLDAIADARQAQPVVSLTPAALEALEGAAASDATAVASDAGRTVLPDGWQARASARIGMDWELRADTGWGVYGTHLALGVEGSGIAQVALFAADATELSPVTRFRLTRALDEGRSRAERGGGASPAAGAPIAFDGLMLRALGNNVSPGPLWDRIRAPRNVGVIFFEDPAFDAGALERARSLDLIVTGSAWNEAVLRGRGLTNVRTVLQGIDPTVFHPAPPSGQLAGRFVIFSGGKLEYRKGQDLVVAAFRAFRTRHPEALLLTAWHNNWPQLMADMELAGHVRGVPAVTNGRLQVREWLAANGIDAADHLDVGRLPNAMMGQVVREADVALFPNRCEGGTNLVAMECMAAGVPTIVSCNTGHRDLVDTGGALPLTHQRAARLPTRFFRSVDAWGESEVEEMVEALEAVYRDRALARQLAVTGADAMRRMSWPTQIAALLDLLHPMI